jgi:hypothetical protein
MPKSGVSVKRGDEGFQGQEGLIARRLVDQWVTLFWKEPKSCERNQPKWSLEPGRFPPKLGPTQKSEMRTNSRKQPGPTPITSPSISDSAVETVVKFPDIRICQ